IGAVGAALTAGARRGGVLLTLLVLPLYIPVLIFGAGAVQSAVAGPGARAHSLVLAAALLTALPLCPWAAGAARRPCAESRQRCTASRTPTGSFALRRPSCPGPAARRPSSSPSASSMP